MRENHDRECKKVSESHHNNTVAVLVAQIDLEAAEESVMKLIAAIIKPGGDVPDR